MPSSRGTHGSLVMSLVIHGVIALCLFFFLLGVDEKVEELLNVSLFEVKKTTPPKPRPRIVKPVVAPQPQEWQGDTVYETVPKSRTRSVASSSVKRAEAQFTQVTRFANESLVQVGVQSAPITATRLQVTTAVDLPVVEAGILPITSGPMGTSEGIGRLGEAAELGGEGGGTGIGRGGSGGQGSGGGGYRFAEHASLSMVNEVDFTGLTDVLSGMADDIRLGSLPVEPLPSGQPGGRVVGRGRDIRGVARFVRLQHRLADWWTDSSSLTALVHFINANTGIHTDLNVEGGSLKLTDPGIMKSPVVFMTGHDPALGKQIGQLGQMTGPTARRFTDLERRGLRRYLLGSGLLFYDDCGLDSKDFPLMRILAAELRTVLPEHTVSKIPNDHDVYNCYYPLGGPPWGCAFIWRHGPQAPIRDYLEGIVIDGRLAVLLCGRDYLCAAQTVEMHAGKVHKFIPAYRMMTNVLVYSLTHGSISDHHRYVPVLEDLGEVPMKPPAIPVLK